MRVRLTLTRSAVRLIIYRGMQRPDRVTGGRHSANQTRLIDSSAIAGSLIQAARATQPAPDKPIRLAGFLPAIGEKNSPCPFAPRARFARSRRRGARIRREWRAGEGSVGALTYLVTVGVEATPGERAG